MKDYNHKITNGSPIRGEYLKLSRAKAIYKAAMVHPYTKDVLCYVNGKGDAIVKMRMTHLEIMGRRGNSNYLPFKRYQYTRSICTKKRFSNGATSFKCKAVYTACIIMCVGCRICRYSTTV